MSNTGRNNIMTDRVSYYFKSQWNILLIITISGLIYNLGLLAGPWFEGRMTGCLVNILGGKSTFTDMLILVICYVIAIAVVQISRYIKRFYVRRFANNVNKNMKEVLYNSLVHKRRPQLKEEGAGDILTKAILDVDDCAEGMRKFTTEIFDTGVALAAYAGMLLFYDWRLGLICMIFPPISYIIAEKMKAVVQKTGAEYKVQSGRLSEATLDRAENAVTYRVYGCEQERKQAEEACKSTELQQQQSPRPTNPFDRLSQGSGIPSSPVGQPKETFSPAQPELLTRAFKVITTRENIIALGDFMNERGIDFDKIEIP